MMRSFRGLLQQIIDSLWLTILFTYILLGIFLTPFHGDESTQIFLGRDFYYHTVTRDAGQVTFQDWDSIPPEAATEQDLRLKDGSVSKYLYGATAYLYGYSLDDINGQWVWGSGWDWNHANGHVPTEGLLIRSRIVSAILLASGMMILYTIAFQAAWRKAAYVATLLYATSPALLLNGHRAMQEGGLAFFSLLVVLAGIWVIEQRSQWAYVWLGVFSGFAVASKHTGVVTVAAIFFACASYFIYQGIRRHFNARPARKLSLLALSGIISLLVFYILNPVWWSNPLARAQDVIQIRSDFMTAQVSTFGGYEDTTGRIRGFLRQTFGMQNMYAETSLDDFHENLADDINLYEGSLYRGILGDDIPGAPYILFGLMIIGAIMLLRDDSMPPTMRWLLGVWAFVMFAFTLFMTPLEWQRYYLPAYPAVMLLAGFGVCYILFSVQNVRLRQ